VRSTVDTAICTKPGGDLAGQLLYGDSLQCSNWAMGLARRLGRSGLTAPRCAMLCSTQFVLPNRNIMSNYPRSGFRTNRHVACNTSAVARFAIRCEKACYNTEQLLD